MCQNVFWKARISRSLSKTKANRKTKEKIYLFGSLSVLKDRDQKSGGKHLPFWECN